MTPFQHLLERSGVGEIKVWSIRCVSLYTVHARTEFIKGSGCVYKQEPVDPQGRALVKGNVRNGIARACVCVCDR
ncbi:unnamed protein product [Symbiodinium necroappetens]|uniref:Uncharacterized protein n=1 Tax=Symbiodinium necroappetens TaxID=1628268 RepID=A0A812PXZ9_9DINO|nr:unnamed protein product [Symbiodinium necroappetens]